MHLQGGTIYPGMKHISMVISPYRHKDLNCRNAITCWNCNKYRHIDQNFGMTKPPKPKLIKLGEEN